jgi:signal transduction histidine kinase
MPLKRFILLFGLLLTCRIACAQASSEAFGPLRVACFSHPPFCFMDEHGDASGFFVELMRGIALEEGWELQFVFGSWDEGLSRIQSGEVDLVLSSARTPDREKFLSFGAESALSFWTQVYVAKGLRPQSVADLRGLRVALMRGDHNADSFCRKMGSLEVVFEKVPVDSFHEGFDLLRMGRADAVVTTQGYGYTQESKAGFERTPLSIEPFPVYIAGRKSIDPSVLHAMDRHLGKWKSDPNSRYYVLLDQWTLGSPVVSTEVPDWVFRSLAVVIGAAVFLLGVFVFLRMRIRHEVGKVEVLNQELRQLNEQLQFRVRETVEARDAAERAHQAKNAFLANMSHELRTPLNGIVGMIALIESSDAGEDLESYHHVIRNSAENLNRMIADLLNVSRLESAWVRLNSEPFDLERAVVQVAGPYACQAFQKGLQFECFLDADLPRYVEGDSEKLRQVIGHLLSNALKFSSKGSFVRLRVSVQKPVDGHWFELLFAVEDSGAGIDPLLMKAIFEPFVQGDLSYTKKHEGAGLGLAIVRRHLELMGSTLEVDSTPGRGTKVSFVLCIASVEGMRECLVEPADRVQGRRCYLMGDFGPDTSIMERQLGSLGWQVTLLEGLLEGGETPDPEAVILVGVNGFCGWDFDQRMAPVASMLGRCLFLVREGDLPCMRHLQHRGMEAIFTPFTYHQLQRCLLHVGRKVSGVELHDSTDSPDQWRDAGLCHRVMLMEPLRSNRVIMTRSLELAGFEVLHLDAVEELPELMQANPCALAVISVSMLTEGLFQTLRGMRKSLASDGVGAARWFRYLFLVPSCDPAALARCGDEACDAYLLKPVSMGQLIAKARDLLAHASLDEQA